MEVPEELKKLEINSNGVVIYKAGAPAFQRNFTRDSVISAILMQNPIMLRDQLIYSSRLQGKIKNPLTGEEEGKIFHEYPGSIVRGLSTEFNACDSTALFLIGHEIYQKLTNDTSLAQDQNENIVNASKYIISHLKNDAFIEDPSFSNAAHYALKVTYWKDSEIIHRNNGEPLYPVTYLLAHVQNMRAIKSVAFLLNDKKYEDIAAKMSSYFKNMLYDKKNKLFSTTLDLQGKINSFNSDILHALFYLYSKDLDDGKIKAILKSAEFLETSAGYRTLEKNEGTNISAYHTRTVWPFEQAIINIGARKFKLSRLEEISTRVMRYLDNSNIEILLIDGEEISKAGNSLQLWTIAAKEYFKYHQNGVFP